MLPVCWNSGAAGTIHLVIHSSKALKKKKRSGRSKLQRRRTGWKTEKEREKKSQPAKRFPLRLTVLRQESSSSSSSGSLGDTLPPGVSDHFLVTLNADLTCWGAIHSLCHSLSVHQGRYSSLLPSFLAEPRQTSRFTLSSVLLLCYSTLSHVLLLFLLVIAACWEEQKRIFPVVQHRVA